MVTKNTYKIDSDSFQIKLEAFEGPFDLLLSLISKQEIDIYQISIAQIAQEYLAYIQRMKELDLDIASEFLLMAAILLDLKASGLIPTEKVVQLEELSPEEVRANLISRLIEYKKFKNAAACIGGFIEANQAFLSRQAELEEQFVNLIPDFSGKIKVEKLAQFLIELIRIRSYNIVDASHIAPIPLSVEQQIDYVLDKLKSNQKHSFYSLTRNFTDKHAVIATFLALLELYKEGAVSLNQAVTFGQIEIELVTSHQ